MKHYGNLPNNTDQSVNNIPLSTDCFSLGILLLGSLSNSVEVTEVEKFAYLGKEGAEKNIWSNMCSRILEEQNK